MSTTTLIIIIVVAVVVIVLLAIFFSGFTSPPPESERAVALGALGLWLFVPWGYWVDRHRRVVPESERGAVSGIFRNP